MLRGLARMEARILATLDMAQWYYMWYQREVTGALEAGLLEIAAGPIRCSRRRTREGKTRLTYQRALLM